MAVSFDELKSSLETTNLKFLCDQEKETILVVSSGCNGVYHLILRRVEDGEGLLLRVQGLAIARSDHPFKAKVLETLLTENHRVKIGRFCYDPNDGEVYLDWFLPLEDGTVTSQQLKRCIIALFHLADEMMPRLRRLLELGEDLPPEEIGVKGMIQRLLQEGARRGLLSEDAEVRLRRLLSQMEETEEESESP